MKTILLFSPTGFIGGAERNLINICKYLPKKEFKVIVVLPFEGQLPGVLKKQGAMVIDFKTYFLHSGQIFNVLIGCVLLWWKLRKERIDIVHTNSIFSLYLPVYFAWLFRKPAFVHWADFDVRKGDKELINMFSRNTTVFAVSKSIQAHLIKSGIKEKVVKLLYYGNEQITKEICVEDRAIFNKKYNIQKNDIIFGMTGRIDDWKGHRYALKALVAIKHYPVKLFILGDYHLLKADSLKTELEAIINNNQLQDQVVFTGHINNPYELIKYFDIVLTPSDYEPFGLVATEAMALGKPVIASDVGGFRESVLDGETGFRVPAKNDLALAEKMEVLVRNTVLRDHMGIAGYERFKNNFSMDLFIKNIKEAYSGKK